MIRLIKFNELLSNKLSEKSIFVVPGINKDIGDRLKNDGYDMVLLI